MFLIETLFHCDVLWQPEIYLPIIYINTLKLYMYIHSLVIYGREIRHIEEKNTNTSKIVQK